MKITEQQARDLCEAAGWEFQSLGSDTIVHSAKNPGLILPGDHVTRLDNEADIAEMSDAICDAKGWDSSVGRWYKRDEEGDVVGRSCWAVIELNDECLTEIGGWGDTRPAARLASLLDAIGANTERNEG